MYFFLSVFFNSFFCCAFSVLFFSSNCFFVVIDELITCDPGHPLIHGYSASVAVVVLQTVFWATLLPVFMLPSLLNLIIDDQVIHFDGAIYTFINHTCVFS